MSFWFGIAVIVLTIVMVVIQIIPTEDAHDKK